MRVTRVKMFIGSDLEIIERSFQEFFGDSLCPCNLISTALYMHNNVYQYEVIYVDSILTEELGNPLSNNKTDLDGCEPESSDISNLEDMLDDILGDLNER